MFRMHLLLPALLAAFTIAATNFDASAQELKPTGTTPLTMEGDLAPQMVDGIDRFLLNEIEKTAANRAERFRLDTTSPEAYEESLKPHREKLAKCLGIRDARLPFAAPEIVVGVGGDSVIAQSEKFTVQAIRWPVLGDPSPQGAGLASIFGEGLLLTPKGDVVANIIVLPDADQTPEQMCGLAEGIAEESQVARYLAGSGCRVVIPALISRRLEKRLGRAELTNREYLHRASFELGRTLAGYEVQMSLSIVDWFNASYPETSVGVFGYGEGGMLALFAAGLDTRIEAACVSGFFGPREQSWKEPIDRNFAGLLNDFGARELATLAHPGLLLVETSKGPELLVKGNGGGPAELKSTDEATARGHIAEGVVLMATPQGNFGAPPSLAALVSFLKNQLMPLNPRPVNGLMRGRNFPRHGASRIPQSVIQEILNIRARAAADEQRNDSGIPAQVRTETAVTVSKGLALPEPTQRETRLLKQIDRHNQALLRESHFVRQQFMSKLDMTSVEAYEKSAEHYREIFRKDVIGEFDQPLMEFNARSRKSWDTEKWTGHEVVLDVFPDVFAYGVLLLPKDLKPGEKRPVVVCQHGLEGRPTDVFLGDNPAYHDFAAKLCERGFITFSPQNPYIFHDRFRTLQRKAQPLGKSLFSIIVPQHQQIVNWLKTQPNVDGDRIAFYGLSYGGKSAMRIPALVTDYCLSICSADFNEWVLKNASTRENFSYMWTGEYEIFEWDLGSTFNYAEMAALICPRPFMVERGHFDGVGEDHWVAYEYAKIRNLYAAQLKIGDKTEIEWFVGPHTINGQGSYKFLHKHLNWPSPAEN